MVITIITFLKCKIKISKSNSTLNIMMSRKYTQSSHAIWIQIDSCTSDSMVEFNGKGEDSNTRKYSRQRYVIESRCDKSNMSLGRQSEQHKTEGVEEL